MPAATTLKLKLKPPATRVSYVDAVTSVLNALGIKRDCTDVAGTSGYGFVINVHPTLSPSGPTAFDMEMLMQGTRALGIDTQLFTAPRNPRDDERNAAELFERVREEIDAGRPCVVWGAASSPEFGVVIGYRAEEYVVRSSSGPVALNVPARGLCAEGSFCLVTFGEPGGDTSSNADRDALARAVQLLVGRHPCYFPGYNHGAAAFEAWADSLAGQPESVNPAGIAYNAACYAELQGFAAGFCTRMAGRNRAGATPLGEAAAALRASAANLERLSALFPLPTGAGPAGRAQVGARLLAECAGHVRAAAGALQRALALM